MCSRFIFNNYSSFVNSLLSFVRPGDGVYIRKNCHSKVKKNKAPFHAVVDKLLGQQENYGDQRQRI